MKKPAHRLSIIVLTALFITSAYGAVGDYEVIDLGTLGAGQTIATGINNLGQVVGYSGKRIFLWQDGEMTDLGIQSEY